jgi:LPS sulfotransferase NodH
MSDAGYVSSEGLYAMEEPGIDPAELAEDELLREMASLHRTRLDTLRHAADTALATHLRRTAELETEYLARHPGREVDPHRLRDGADDTFGG